MAQSGAAISADRIHGFYEVQAALKALDKNAARRMDASINKAAEGIARSSREQVQGDILSGFARQLPGGKKGARRRAYGGGYDDEIVRKGIRVRRKRQARRGNALRSFVVIANTTPLGAIWEVAGRRSAGATPQGAAMIRNITNRDGSASRTIWRVVDSGGADEARETIRQAIDDARAQCQRAVNKA